MTWDWPVLIFLGTWAGVVSAEKRTGVPSSTLGERRLRARAALETPEHRSADIACSWRWRKDPAKVLPNRGRDLAPLLDVGAIRDPQGYYG